MTRYTFPQIEQNIAKITGRQNYDGDFLFELLAAYGRSASSITQLRNGVTNKSKVNGEVLQKDVVFWKVFDRGTQLEPEVFNMKDNELVEKFHPRFLIATDYYRMAAYDLLNQDTLTIPIKDLARHVQFFMAWSGKERLESEGEESEVDRKAAERMKDFYDVIERENLDQLKENGDEFMHGLNIFFSRLLFCLFAEDTELFQKNQFSEAFNIFVEPDGSNMQEFFIRLFDALNTKDDEKGSLGEPFRSFPYVNGSIFDTVKHKIIIPKFGPDAYHILLFELVKYDWSDINPDIFGTIYQGIMNQKVRDENGMDYTSVSNIDKLIKPLFLNELNEQFEKTFDDDGRVKDKGSRRIQNLEELWDRISKIKIFDPACGSGNFLVISYKRLRALELRILNEMVKLRGGNFIAKFTSRIKLENFYGIELMDFPRELAILSLFVAEHQMNMQFNDEFGKKIKMLPIEDENTPHIVCGNAANLDWQTICPNTGHNTVRPTYQANNLFDESFGYGVTEKTDTNLDYDEIYVIGNPPYKGSRDQKPSQKKDMELVLSGDFPKYKLLDYIAIWLYKGANYIKGTRAKLAFLSTNSIVEGEQVATIWPYILSIVEIPFAYTSFLWRNNASGQAGVYCVIIGLGQKTKAEKYIYSESSIEKVDHINAYLVNSDDIYVGGMTKSLSMERPAQRGSELGDGNKGENLSVDKNEKEKLETNYPELKGCFRLLANSKDVLRGNMKRYGIWLVEKDINTINCPEIKERIENVAKTRPQNPHLFSRISVPSSQYIFIPQLSSERRKYIPITFLDADVVPLGPHFYVDDATLYDFSILSSSMHMAWMRAISGKFKKDYRYSSELVYNTFPLPPLTTIEKERLSEAAENILMARENHSEMSLAQMYDPDTMPSDLREAHDRNDILVDKLYRSMAFPNDEERLKVLFDLYEKMTNK